MMETSAVFTLLKILSEVSKSISWLLHVSLRKKKKKNGKKIDADALSLFDPAKSTGH